MVMVSVSDLQAKLGEYLERAKAGEDVVVTEDGKPVVKLRAVEDERARMERLAAQGLVKLGTGRIPKEFWDHEPVRLSPGAPADAALQAVLAEREESPY